MTKQNNLIFWIIGIVVLVLLIINFQTPKPQQTDLEEGIVGLTPHYYKDGVEVFPQEGLLKLKFFTIVTPPGVSFTQIAFDIPGAAAGEIPFSNIKIVDASPTAFKDALPTTTKSLTIGESKTLWTSNLMDTEQFEAISPVNFWVKVSAVNDYTGDTVYAEGYSGDITFEAETPEEGFGNISYIKVVDGTSSITYNWANGVWDAPPEAIKGDSIMVQAGIKNQGAVADIIWGEFSSAQVTPAGALAVSPWNMDVGTIWGPQWNFIMPTTDVSIKIDAGHGSTLIQDSTQSFIIKLPEPFLSFYQETADTYSFTDDWSGSSYCAFDWNKFKDGNWDTYLSTATSGGACAGQATMVYQKPVGSTSVIWKVKDEYGTKNLNIPSSCWSASSTDLTLRYRSYYSSLSNYLLWECYDGGTGHEGFSVLWTSPSRPGYPEAYEEAVTWN